MAKILVFICVLSAIILAAEASADPLNNPATKKSIDDLNLLFKKVNDAAINSATAPAEKLEAARASVRHINTAELHVAKAAKEGDEKKVGHLILAYTRASTAVINAPPAEKLKVMDDTFNSAAAPNAFECPNVDKAYCQTRYKLTRLVLGVTASPEHKALAEASNFKETMHAAIATINRAYANGDDKEIARVLDAFNKAADSVIAAPPSEKLKVMESTFAAASGA